MRSWPNLKYSNHKDVPLMPTTPSVHDIERIANIKITDPFDTYSAASSITVFRQNPGNNSSNKITLCRNPDCKDEDGADAKLELDFDNFENLSPPYTFYGPRPPPAGFPEEPSQQNVIKGIPDLKALQWNGTGENINFGYSLITPQGVSAIDFDAGNYILVLFKKEDYLGDAWVLRSSQMVLDTIDFNDKVASMIIIKGQ